MLDAVLKLLPPQSRVAEYIKRHQDQRSKKELPSWSRTDVIADPPTTFSRRAASSLSMDDLSQRVAASGGQSSNMSPDTSGRKLPKQQSDIFSCMPAVKRGDNLHEVGEFRIKFFFIQAL